MRSLNCVPARSTRGAEYSMRMYRIVLGRNYARRIAKIFTILSRTTFQETRDNGRSFTSTEAQTELPLQNGPEALEELDGVRGARRRERRMRRHRRALRSCSMPPTYPGASPGCQASSTAPGVPLVAPARGFLHPPPPHLGLRGLSLGLPFPVSTSVSAFGR